MSANTNHALEAGGTALAHNTHTLERGEFISSSRHLKLNTMLYVNYILIKLGVGSRKVKKKKKKKKKKKQTSSGRDLAMSPEHFVLTQGSWKGYANGPVE